MEEQRNANVVLTADVAGYQQGMAESAKQTEKLATSIDSLSKKLSSLRVSTGRGLTIFSAGTAASLTAAAMAAGKFEKNLSTLAAQAAVSNKNVDLLKASIIDLSKQYPISLNQATQMVTMLSQMGVATEQAINRMAAPLTKLSGATGTDLLGISQAMVELGRTMGTLNAGNIERYANSLVNVSAKAGVSAQSVLEFSNAIAPIARVAGITEEAVMGISAAFARAGADGYAGAQAFNRMVYGLTRSLQFGGPELKIYANLLGTTTEQLQSMAPAEVVLETFEALNSQGPKAIKTLDALGLDGLRTLRSIQAVVQSGDMRSAYESALTGGDSLEKASEAAFGGFYDQLERMKTQLQTFGVIIGENLLGPFTGATAAANELLSVVNAIAATPLGDIATFLTSGVGLAAGAIGGGLLAAKGIGTVATAGVGLNSMFARALMGGFMVGRDPDAGEGRGFFARNYARRGLEGYTSGAMGPINSRAFLLSQALGGLVPRRPPGEPSAFSRAMAMPVRGASWLINQQSQFYGDSQLLKDGPVGIAKGYYREQFAPLADYTKNFGSKLGFAAGATDDAAKSAIGFSKAAKQAAQASALMAVQANKAALSTLGWAGRSAATGMYNLMGGPTGMALTAGIGGWMAYDWFKKDQQPGKDFGTLAINKYSEAMGLAATASMNFAEKVSEEASKIPAPQSMEEATRVTQADIKLARQANRELIEPIVGQLTTSDQVMAYLRSFGQLNKEQVQAIKFDLVKAAQLPTSEINRLLTTYVETMPSTGTGSTFNWSQDYFSGFEKAPGFFDLSGGRGGANPFKADFWRVLGDGVTGTEKDMIDTAIEQIGATYEQNAERYGSPYADVEQAKQVQEMLIALKDQPQAVREQVEQTLASKFPQFEGGINWSGIDWAFTGQESESGIGKGLASTGAEKQANVYGYTFNPDNKDYTYLEPGSQAWGTYQAQVRNDSPSYNAFQATALGKQMSNEEFSNEFVYTEKSNAKIQGALKVLRWANQTGDALAEIEAARGTATADDLATLDMAKQLENMQFEYGLRVSNYNTQQTMQLKEGRIEEQLAALNPESTDYAEQKLALEQSLMDQQAQQNQYFESVLLAKREFDVSMERSEEEYQISRSRTIEDYNRQIRYQTEDFYRQQRYAQQDFNRQMQYMVEDSMAAVYDPYTRIVTQPTLDSGNLVQNLVEQNQALQEQERNLKQLSKMGLTQDAIDFLGLADPKNAQQLARLLSDAASDPTVIRELNRLTKEREEGTADLVASRWSRQYRRAVNEFERQSNRAIEQFNRQVARSDDAFDRGLSRMQEDHERQLDNALEDFNRSFKEITGNFGHIENRALNILKDAGIKVVDEGENQMDRMMRSVARKYGILQTYLSALENIPGGNGGGGGARSGVNPQVPDVGGSTGRTSYAGTGVTISHQGSLTVSPYITSTNRYESDKLADKGKDDNLRRRNRFLEVAYNQIGDPYVYGTEGPDTFDCSGLVQFSARKAGVDLPRTAAAQMGATKSINGSQALPGDLVGFNRPGGRAWDHIGIYVGNGRFIHAPNPDATVRVGSISEQEGTVGYRRIKQFATGGIATRRMVAEIAEAGYPEAVIPLNNHGHNYLMDMYKAVSREIVKSMLTASFASPIQHLSGGSQYINASTNINGPIKVVADDPNRMLRQLEQKKRREALLKPSRARSG